MENQPVISAALVKTLRERTNAGMMECKHALSESHGDLDKAADALRKKGLAKADKKADRVTAEGMLAVRHNTHTGIILEVNCETDFVARDSNFTAFVNAVADAAFAQPATTLEAVLALTLANGETVETARRHLVAKIGENIQVRRYHYLHSQYKLASYLHGTRIAALVEYAGDDAAIARDIAMQVVANHPRVVSPQHVSNEIREKEREIFTAQAAESGKPANIIAKMVDGRIQKFLEDMSLITQPFLKDPEKTVQDILTINKIDIYHFVRFAAGEGIEKKTEDFAAEVMAQVKGS